MGQFIKTIVGLIMFVHFFSCTDTYTICDVNTGVYEKSGFYHITGGIEQVAYAPSFSLQPLGSTSPIYSNVATISKFSLPLNPLLDSAKYQLSVNLTAYPDTITFVYTNQPFTINPDCGNIYINTLTRVSVTKHHVDSATIVNNMVTNVSGENLKIYF